MTKLCKHWPSDVALNPEADDCDKVYQCAKCGRPIKPIYGLGKKGRQFIFTVTLLFTVRMGWLDPLESLIRENTGRIGGGLLLFAFVIVYALILYAIWFALFKYVVPAYRALKDWEI